MAKLCSFDEHYMDFTGVLQVARALREQIDWEEVWRRTERSPYATTFRHLLRELGVAPDGDQADSSRSATA